MVSFACLLATWQALLPFIPPCKDTNWPYRWYANRPAMDIVNVMCACLKYQSVKILFRFWIKT